MRRVVLAVVIVAALGVCLAAQPSRWHQETAEGLRLLDKKAYEGAELQLRAALKEAEALGPLRVALSLIYLGLLYERQDRLAEAKPLYQQALSIREKELAPDDLVVASSLEHYARLLGEMEETSQAHAMQARAQAIRAKHMQAMSSEAPAGEVFRAADCGQPPQLIHRVNPEYTEEGRLFHREGVVQLRVEIRPDGRPHNLRLERSIGLGLDEKAAEAVQQWRFRPAIKGGRPVIVEASVTVHFRLL
jgi:TonB family protein